MGTMSEPVFDDTSLHTASIYPPLIIDEATEERIRHIVRQELANLLPDIKRALKQEVVDFLASEIRKRAFAQKQHTW